jgi:hypothetical protein
VSLSSRYSASSGCGWRVAANILNKQSRRADKGWSSSLGGGGLGEGLTSPHLKRKKTVCYEILHRASELPGPSEHGNEPSGSINFLTS